MGLVAPNGIRIRGTLEQLTGVAQINSIERLPDGTLDFDYEGGTEVFYDEAVTVERDGKIVFVDEEGDEWTEDQLVEEASIEGDDA